MISLILYISGTIGVIAVITTLYFYAKNKGKKEEKKKNIDEFVRINNEVKEQLTAVDCLDDAGVRDELREFTRD